MILRILYIFSNSLFMSRLVGFLIKSSIASTSLLFTSSPLYDGFPLREVRGGVGEFSFEESEVESDCIERDSNVLQEFIADNEHYKSGDEFVASSDWSSLSFILETQDQS